MNPQKILLAVTGSIAAYKSAFLIRQLVKQSVEVRVIMTPSATAFISPLTLSTLSKNEVHIDVINENSWNNHVELGLWADAMIIAPATANTIAKMSNGICDNIVSAVYLSAKCPVFVAPAMDLDMWKHQSTQNNIKQLKSYGNLIIDVGAGELASGLIGKGRMAEPEEILNQVNNFFAKKKDLIDQKVLITAGPTHENIDPVRFIGNRSSGKMGVALAEECAWRGAKVRLVLGPSQEKTFHPNISVTRINSADEMYAACLKFHKDSTISIFSAAVSDYKSENIESQKIKKSESKLQINLTKNIDIAKSLGDQKLPGQIHIGFALETQNEKSNAKAKLDKKNFDFIVLNSLNDKGAGFQHETNKISIFTNKQQQFNFDLKSKREVAADIINTLVSNYVNV